MVNIGRRNSWMMMITLLPLLLLGCEQGHDQRLVEMADRSLTT